MKVSLLGLYALLLIGGALILVYQIFHIQKGAPVVTNSNLAGRYNGTTQGTTQETTPKESLKRHDTFGYLKLTNESFTGGSLGDEVQPIGNVSSHTSHVLPKTVDTEEVVSAHAHKSPDKDTERRLVLILSYQRCGSSFFGGLFDRDPGGLYMYEPLDGLYGAMYGTPEGWNVPSDIMNWPDGTQRILPADEVSAVSNFLGNLLTCRYDKLPTEFLLHKYWIQFKRFESHMEPFTTCLAHTGLFSANGKCRKPMTGLCSSRFNKDIKKQKVCHNSLWNSTSSSTRLNQDARIINPLLAKYSSCMQEHRIKAAGCINKLSRVCNAARVHSTKTVRATMQSVEVLLKSLPNLKILHLIRDPRAVVLSRKNFHSSGQSLYSKGDAVRESKLFCQNLVNDIHTRKLLEEKYSDRIMEVVYDGFVRNPISETERIYDFLDMPLTSTVRDWVITNTRMNSNSTLIAVNNSTQTAKKKKRQSKLSSSQVSQINENCQAVFDLVDYNWALS